MSTSMFTYLLESSICLTVFYLFYRLVLRHEALLGVNRFFILLSLLLSLLIPAIDISLPTQPYLYTGTSLSDITVAAVPQARQRFHIQSLAVLLYMLPCIYLLARLLFQTAKLLRFAQVHKSHKMAGYRLVFTGGRFPTFSFFRLLFWDNTQTLTGEQQEQVLHHELAHIRQWHSLDIVCMEVLKAFFWFHPAVYLYKKELQQQHEYLADAAVVQNYNPQTYIQLILSQLLSIPALPLTNPFSQFQTKNRILMLHKLQQNKAALWKIALSLPLIAVLVLVYSCDIDNAGELIPSQTKKAGAQTSKSTDQIYEVVEKMPAPVNNLQLDMAQRINYPQEARRNKIEGKVLVQFIVRKDGSVDDIKILKGIDDGCDAEAVRVIEEMPAWKPGMQDGQPVDVRMVVPVAFALSDEKRAKLMNNSDERMQSLEQHGTGIYELEPPSPQHQQIFRVVEVQPEPQGGIQQLFTYLSTNIKYPQQAVAGKVEGKVFVQFVVKHDGSIADVQLLKGLGHGCDQEALRVVKEMPKWKPGFQNGKPVSVQMSLPIAFNLN